MRDFEGQNYINGKWIPIKNEDTYSKINPATGKYLGLFPKSNKDVVHEAYLSAREAFSSWKSMSRFVRSDLMYRVSKIIEERREELATAISLETGKNYNESIAEVNEALHMAQFAFGSGRNSHGEAVSSEV